MSRSAASARSFVPQSSNLYQFSKKREARLIHLIDQELADRLLAKRVVAREAIKEVEEIEEYITIALRSGAQMEPGLRTAELLTVHRKAHSVPAGSFTRLVVK